MFERNTAAAEAAFQIDNPLLPTSSHLYSAAGQAELLLPAPEVAHVAPALRPRFLAMPPEQRTGIKWDHLAAAVLYADLPPSETTAVLVDVAGRRMVDLTRELAARVAQLELDADLFTEDGFYRSHSDLMAQHRATLDQVFAAVLTELARLDSEAAAAIARHTASSFQVAPDVELVARQRWQDAFAAGPGQVAVLFDGVTLAGDVASSHALARIAETAIAAAMAQPAGDGDAFSRALAVQPLVDALCTRLKPPEVQRAVEMRAAVAEATTRAQVLRASLGG